MRDYTAAIATMRAMRDSAQTEFDDATVYFDNVQEALRAVDFSDPCRRDLISMLCAAGGRRTRALEALMDARRGLRAAIRMAREAE